MNQRGEQAMMPIRTGKIHMTLSCHSCCHWRYGLLTVGLSIILASSPVSTKAGQYGDFTYASDGAQVTIIGYTGTGGVVVIPDVIDGFPVTSLGLGSFRLCTNLTSVTIGTNVTDIGESAFAASSLHGILFPDGLTNIGNYAFAFCSNVSDITIPNRVTTVGNEAFLACSNLISLTIGTNVTAIGEGAFSQCVSLTNVVIPSNVSSIGNAAFGGCLGLTAIMTDTSSSYYCSIDGVLFDKGQKVLVQCPAGKVGTYTIPQSVTSICAYAFLLCVNLTGLAMPDSVTHVGALAFRDCVNLGSLTLSSRIQLIPDGMCYNCSSLASITIPSGATIIGDEAFYACAGLTSVTIPASVSFIGTDAFAQCTNLSRVYFEGDYLHTWRLFGSSTNATIYYLPGAKNWGSSIEGCPTVLWNPTFSTINNVGGVVSCTVTGTPTIPVALEVSTNLTAGAWWGLQTTNLNGNGAVDVADHDAINQPARFYRVVGP